MQDPNRSILLLLKSGETFEQEVKRADIERLLRDGFRVAWVGRGILNPLDPSTERVLVWMVRESEGSPVVQLPPEVEAKLDRFSERLGWIAILLAVQLLGLITMIGLLARG